MIKKNNSIQYIAINFIKNKNNQTFTKLINRLRPGLMSFAYKFVKDHDLAEEIVSKTFIAVWKKIDQYNPKYNFSTWVYAIAKNEALGILRNDNKNSLYNEYNIQKYSKLSQAYNLVFNMNTEVMEATGEELIQKLYDASISAINELKEPYRTVMYEREINQKSLNDIANDLNWNLSTVKTRLRKARKDIAEIVYKKYPDAVDAYLGEEN